MPRTVSRSGSRSARHASKHKATKSRKKSRKSRKKNESSASDSDNSKSNHKRRLDERHRSVSSDDDDLKLNKELHPIGYYMRDRVEMVRQMFATLRRSELKKMLPEKLK
uniref:Uncharacterized protein n=1 Tax=Plectus sambesii TaxID=2011161 RepID=A0A914X2D6_9BILA